MGYYTAFDLKWDDAEVDDQVAEWIESTDYPMTAFQPNGDTEDTCKWYDHEDDVSALSKLHPTVLFTLSGEGEESGDIWRKYFLNGKMEACKAVITFPPCTLRSKP